MQNNAPIVGNEGQVSLQTCLPSKTGSKQLNTCYKQVGTGIPDNKNRKSNSKAVWSPLMSRCIIKRFLRKSQCKKADQDYFTNFKVSLSATTK